FLRQHLLWRRLADRRHRFHLEFIGNAQLHSRAFVVKAFHTMHDETLPPALQRKVLPGRSSIIRMRDRWFVVVIERLSRNKEDEDSGILCPGLVCVDK